MSTILASDVPAALRGRRIFRTKSGLHADRFYRLSGPPAPREGLTRAQDCMIMAAAEINRAHYMPYCARCRQGVTFGHKDLHVWVHEQDGADHVPEVTSGKDSHSDHPKGLQYVVWVGAEIVAWVLNDQSVTHVDGTSHPRLRAVVREALGG